jgi:hypothetical protein
VLESQERGDRVESVMAGSESGHRAGGSMAGLEYWEHSKREIDILMCVCCVGELIMSSGCVLCGGLCVCEWV